MPNPLPHTHPPPSTRPSPPDQPLLPIALPQTNPVPSVSRAPVRSTISPDSVTRLALEAWQPHHNPPRLLSVGNLNRMIAELDGALVPAGDDTYARALGKLIEFATAFGIPCGDPAAVQRIYREKLANLPDDLLMAAVARVTDMWTWGQRLPMPAEIRATVSRDFTDRRVLRARASMALRKAKDLEAYRSQNKDDIVPPEKWAELRASLAVKHRSHRQRDDT